MAPRTGTVESGVRADLRGLPDAITGGALAKSALLVARLLDDPATETKDVAGLGRELRALVAAIQAASPRKEEGDGVTKIRDDLAARRKAAQRAAAADTGG
jgi:hypothetical protein